MKSKREDGVALITALLVLFLASALVVGMSWMVMSDQRLGGNNRDRESAFYAAEAGMETMTAQMGNYFAAGTLTAADITAIEAAPPSIPGITFQNALGQSTYQLTAAGAPESATILPPSPYAGMNGLLTPYTLTVAAQTVDGSEVKLQRSVQDVAIPVFQFGIFSQTDLSFFAGPSFDFGGRVHTNGNLWLAANEGPLYMRDKITVVGQVIRTNLENGYPVSSSTSGTYGGYVTIATPAPQPAPDALPGAAPYTNSQWRSLAETEGSVSGNSTYGAISGTANNPTWTNTVLPAYHGMLQNGVQPLNLVAAAIGGLSSPINLIRRPLVGEQASNPPQFNERDFSQASLRILLDSYPTPPTPALPGTTAGSTACNGADMMFLDTIDTSTQPLDLATLDATITAGSAPAWWAGSTQTFYPLPTSGAGGSYNKTTGYWIPNGQPIITGCLKIEYQNAAGAWHDVTKEILKEGFIGRNINPQTCAGCTVGPTLDALPVNDTIIASQGPPGTGVGCTDPNPNAIIRLARLRDNPSTATSGGCGTATQHGYDYWPLALYDTREGINRDETLANDTNNKNSNPYITAAGTMYYIELDVNNLARWFTGAIGSSGTSALNTTGYAVYFSDRRTNQVDPYYTIKVGAYGFDDMVNPSDPTSGCPNDVLDPGEDLEGDGNFRIYGGNPNMQAYPSVLTGFALTTQLIKPSGTQGVCTAAGTTAPSPEYAYEYTQEARENPPVFFRHALKMVDGTSFSLGTSCFGAAPNPPCGLTVASENPVYIQGDYNAPNNGTWNPVGVASSVVADAVTLLSDNWNDVNSFISPYDPAGGRQRAQTAYRVAIIGGKGIPFARITDPVLAGSDVDFGTDGGLHNFLRYLEGNGGNLYYMGSLVSFYYNRQAVGEYKCCNTVYGAPARTYSFDANFSNGPNWLPPITPRLRSINTIGFSQDLLPTQ